MHKNQSLALPNSNYYATGYNREEGICFAESMPSFNKKEKYIYDWNVIVPANVTL